MTLGRYRSRLRLPSASLTWVGGRNPWGESGLPRPQRAGARKSRVSHRPPLPPQARRQRGSSERADQPGLFRVASPASPGACPGPPRPFGVSFGPVRRADHLTLDYGGLRTSTCGAVCSTGPGSSKDFGPVFRTVVAARCIEVRPRPLDDPNEEEIRLKLAIRLDSEGVCVSAERLIPGTETRRYDLGIHREDGSLAGLIEVKNRTRRALPSRKSRQRANYEASGVPYRYCCGEEDIEEVAAWARYRARSRVESEFRHEA